MWQNQSAPLKPFEALGVLVGALGAFFAANRINNFSYKRIELRADRDGVDYLQKAGYASDGYKGGHWEEPLAIKGREADLPRKEVLKTLLTGTYGHPKTPKRIALLDEYRKHHPDPKPFRKVMSEVEWQKCQASIEPVYEQLELERSVRVLDWHFLSPKALSKFLK